MSNIYFLAIIDISKYPNFVAKHLVKNDYGERTIFNILTMSDILNENTSVSFEYNNAKYLIYCDNDLEVLLMVVNLNYPDSFLAKLALDFKSEYDESNKYTNQSYTFLKSLAIKYNDLNTLSPTKKILEDIEEVRSIMHTNISKALEKCEKLEILIHKTEQLKYQAGIFNNESKKLKNKMCQENAKPKIIISIIAILILLSIIIPICLQFSKK